MNLIAHRGLHSKNTKENTLAALILGNKHPKINGIELDVRLTHDNEVVVIHDESIDRVSNGKGMLREMSLSRLKRFNYGTWIKRSTISTLNEVLDKLTSSKMIIIELKDERDKNIILTNKVLEIIKNYPNLNIWLKSFQEDVVLDLKQKSTRPVGVLIKDDNNHLLNMDVDFYSISKNIISDDVVENLIDKNKNVMVWTVNSKKEKEILRSKIGNNLDNIYIISDYPFKL